MLQILPFRRQVEIHHIGKDHPVAIGRRKIPKDHFPQLISGFPVESAKDLDDGLDGHMVVKEPQIGDLHQLLANGHFPYRGVPDQE